MASMSSTLYNLLFRRNITMLGTVFASAFAMQLAFDTGSERIWDAVNRGRQWKDIKAKYVEQPGGDDDDE